MRKRFASGYEDLNFTAFRKSSTSSPTEAAFIGGIESWFFSNSTQMRELSIDHQLPHNGNGFKYPTASKGVYMHMHISNNNALTVGQVIGLFVEISMAKRNEQFTVPEYYWCSFTSPVAGTLAKTALMTGDIMLSATLQAKFEASAMIKIRVFRHKGTQYTTVNAGNITDALDDSVWFNQMDFHVLRHGVGNNYRPV